MKIDVSAFYGFIGRIQRKVEILERISSAMSNNLSVASRDFNSANFERASEIVSKMQNKMKYSLSQIDSMKRYLNSLQDCVEEYLSLGCR